MRQYLPGTVELLIFATLAVVGAGVVWLMPARDLAISAAAFPIFLGCSIFGLWKHGRLSATRSNPIAAPETIDE